MPGPSPVRPADRGARRRGFLAGLRTSAHEAIERLFSSRVPWIVLFFAAIAPLALGPRLTPEPPALPVGSVAPADIAAAETREFTDEVPTQEAREAARRSIRPVYAVDSRALPAAAGPFPENPEGCRAPAPAGRGPHSRGGGRATGGASSGATAAAGAAPSHSRPSRASRRVTRPAPGRSALLPTIR